MFSFWRHICLTYDAFRDVYKLYVDGEKVDSGSFAGDNRQDDVGPSASVLPYIRTSVYPTIISVASFVALIAPRSMSIYSS